MVIYRAVKNRCAVDIDALALAVHLEKNEILTILAEKKFEAIDVNIVTLARRCCGVATYRRGARIQEAPEVVDCSSFVKWLYGERGIWLPRRSIQQREMGSPVTLAEIAAGDLIFNSGCIDYYFDNPAEGVGHVGIATGEGTVIHAASRALGIIESPLDAFTGSEKFRGARRITPQHHCLITFLTPAEREIETSDDIRWIVLQALAKTKADSHI